MIAVLASTLENSILHGVGAKYMGHRSDLDENTGQIEAEPVHIIS